MGKIFEEWTHLKGLVRPRLVHVDEGVIGLNGREWVKGVDATLELVWIRAQNFHVGLGGRGEELSVLTMFNLSLQCASLLVWKFHLNLKRFNKLYIIDQPRSLCAKA